MKGKRKKGRERKKQSSPENAQRILLPPLTLKVLLDPTRRFYLLVVCFDLGVRGEEFLEEVREGEFELYRPKLGERGQSIALQLRIDHRGSPGSLVGAPKEREKGAYTIDDLEETQIGVTRLFEQPSTFLLSFVLTQDLFKVSKELWYPVLTEVFRPLDCFFLLIFVVARDRCRMV